MKFEIWPIFGIFDLRWPLFTSWPVFLKSWRQERHFDIHFTYFKWSLKFDQFSEFLTFGDLCSPRDPFFWKADVKNVILIYILPTLNEVWNLTFFRNLWPLMTFVDLVTPFFEKLTSRASFWYTFYPLLMKFEFDPKFSEICNLTPNPNFFYWKLFWDSTDHFELLFVEIDRIVDF